MKEHTMDKREEIVEVMARKICPHIRGARIGSQAPCRRCPPTVETDYGTGTNLCRLQATAAARAALSAVEQKGYAIVPVEPSADMIMAGAQAKPMATHMNTLTALDVYTAMLSSFRGGK